MESFYSNQKNIYHSLESNRNITLLLVRDHQLFYEASLLKRQWANAANVDISHIPPHLKALSPQLLASHREGEEVVATLLLFQVADFNPAPLIQLGQLGALQVNNDMAIIQSKQTDVRV